MSSEWGSTRKFLYKTQRTMGDVTAAKNGKLVKRIVRRRVTRSIFRLFR